MTKQVQIKFHQTLNDFLPADKKNIYCYHQFNFDRSVKDLIESIGVPHTEIDLIIVNGQSVCFSHKIQDGETIDVYPSFFQPDLNSLNHCQPESLACYKFILDVHLGKLARHLRLLGFDAAYQNYYDDAILADISVTQQRILLTCDLQLLMRKKVIHGYYVRSREPLRQISEVLSRYKLHDQLKPLTRCISCNGTVQPVAKSTIEDQLLTETKKYYHEFYQCNDCKKIYWKGSHYNKLLTIINNIKKQTAKTV